MTALIRWQTSTNKWSRRGMPIFNLMIIVAVQLASWPAFSELFDQNRDSGPAQQTSKPNYFEQDNPPSNIPQGNPFGQFDQQGGGNFLVKDLSDQQACISVKYRDTPVCLNTFALQKRPKAALSA
jgi:hypothetical protein